MDWVKERASRGYTYHLPRPIVTREGGGPDEFGWDIEDRWDEPPNLNGMTRCYEADIANVDIWRKMFVIRDSYQGESDQENTMPLNGIHNLYTIAKLYGTFLPNLG